MISKINWQVSATKSNKWNLFNFDMKDSCIHANLFRKSGLENCHTRLDLVASAGRLRVGCLIFTLSMTIDIYVLIGFTFVSVSEGPGQQSHLPFGPWCWYKTLLNCIVVLFCRYCCQDHGTSKQTYLFDEMSYLS